jgi:hypothetical protein
MNILEIYLAEYKSLYFSKEHNIMLNYFSPGIVVVKLDF